jgi:hypothetical protein
MVEGAAVTDESFEVESSLAKAFATDDPNRGVEWWIRYDNVIGDRLEVCFSDPDKVTGPNLVERYQPVSGQDSVTGHGHGHSAFEQRSRG